MNQKHLHVIYLVDESRCGELVEKEEISWVAQHMLRFSRNISSFPRGRFLLVRALQIVKICQIVKFKYRRRPCGVENGVVAEEPLVPLQIKEVIFMAQRPISLQLMFPFHQDTI